MKPRELVDRARQAVLAFVSRPGRKGPGAASSSSGTGSASVGSDGFEAGDDGIADLLSGSPPETEARNPGFPGFAPPPSPADRVRASATALAERVRGNPQALLAAGSGLAVLALILLSVALLRRPPKPVAPGPSVSPEVQEILRRIPVPRPDPLAEESGLDRPRKDRYTEEEAARLWLDLGLLPTEDLRERNRAELQELLSAMEKR